MGVVSLFRCLRIQWMIVVVANLLDNPKPFGTPLTEQNSVPNSEVLRTLYKPECYSRTISCPYVASVDVDDSACLGDGSHVQHSLVLRLDGGSVRQDQHFGYEFSIDLWSRRILRLVHDNHAFPNIFSSNVAQCQRCTLTSRASRDGYPLTLDRPDLSRSELTETIRTNQYRVTIMDDTTLDDTRYDGTHERNGESIVDVEFQRSISIVVSVMRKNIQERPNEV